MVSKEDKKNEIKFSQNDINIGYIKGYITGVIYHNVSFPISMEVGKDLMNDVLKILVDNDLVGEIVQIKKKTTLILIHEKCKDNTVVELDGTPYDESLHL